MLVDLHSITISLQSKSELVKKQWRILFDCELARNPLWSEHTEPDLVLQAEVVSSLPPSPANPPSFLTIAPPIAVYAQGSGHHLLRLSNKAQIELTLPYASSNQQAGAHIKMTPRALDDGSFEDITTYALAPLLRRRGLFMIHAFTTVYDHRAVMFVGVTGSGKTTSGLALLASGWQLLANDVALMCHAGAPLALLSPGTVNISPATFPFLPELNKFSIKYPPSSPYVKVEVPRLEFLPVEKVCLSAPIKAVYFPVIGKRERHEVKIMPRAVGLARLMESSMDQWDQATWEDHIDFLERLSREVSFYSLFLGNTMSDLAAVLHETLPQD